jgi:hypothetical protein
MNECAKCRDRMAEALYGEMSPDARASFSPICGLSGLRLGFKLV